MASESTPGPSSSKPQAKTVLYCQGTSPHPFPLSRSSLSSADFSSFFFLSFFCQSAPGRSNTASFLQARPSARLGCRATTPVCLTSTTLLVSQVSILPIQPRISDAEFKVLVLDALKNKMGTLSVEGEKKLEQDVEKQEKKAQKKAEKEEESKKVGFSCSCSSINLFGLT